MSTEPLFVQRSARPDMKRLLRLLKPGGAGDKIIFGYMFRLIYSFAAVLAVTLITTVLVFAFRFDFSGFVFWLFCVGALMIMGVGEAMRRKVYETRSITRENILTKQEVSSRDLVEAETDELYQRLSHVDFPLLLRVQKRTMDIVIAANALVTLFPVLLIVSLLIKFDSSGPILFQQVRIGARGKPISIWKFRTFEFSGADNADPLTGRSATAPQRITRVGKFLRRTAIDELPQLLNVLVGQMSIVGPRPWALRVEGVDILTSPTSFVERYFNLKPGLTGLALVTDSTLISDDFSDQSLEDLLELRRQYIANWSPILDVKIIFRTVLMLRREYRAD